MQPLSAPVWEMMMMEVSLTDLLTEIGKGEEIAWFAVLFLLLLLGKNGDVMQFDSRQREKIHAVLHSSLMCTFCVLSVCQSLVSVPLCFPSCLSRRKTASSCVTVNQLAVFSTTTGPLWQGRSWKGFLGKERERMQTLYSSSLCLDGNLSIFHEGKRKIARITHRELQSYAIVVSSCHFQLCLCVYFLPPAFLFSLSLERGEKRYDCS